MEAESRVKKSLLNAQVNLIFYFLALVLAFFSRKVFLDSLGADFIGLTGTLYNLLGFLNLAELGIGTAIGYVLYKPLFDRDEPKLNEIISVFGYLYRWIGLIILGAGCVLACFMPLIFPRTGFSFGIIYFAYFSFLISSLIGYFLNYRQTLLGADQKNYVVTAYFQTGLIVKSLIQMVSAYYTKNYYLWIAIELFFGIIYSFILNRKINHVYPWLKSEIRLGKKLFKKYPDVMKYTKQLFVHQIALFVQFHTKPFLIYTFASLQTVAYYGNYAIISDKLTLLISNLLGSTSAGVGNLIAEGNKEKTINVFWELLSIRFFLTGCIAFSLYHIVDALIFLWLGEQYIISKLVLLLVICDLSIRMVHDIFGQFLYGFGLFRDIWASIIQSAIYLVLSILCGYFWGLEGILFGGIMALLVIMCGWKPYFLYRYGFKIPIIHYWINYSKCVIAFIISIYIGNYFLSFVSINPRLSFFSLFLYAIIVVLIIAIIYSILLLISMRSMRDIVKRLLYKNRL